jgi:hypothetical protein
MCPTISDTYLHAIFTICTSYKYSKQITEQLLGVGSRDNPRNFRPEIPTFVIFHSVCVASLFLPQNSAVQGTTMLAITSVIEPHHFIAATPLGKKY